VLITLVFRSWVQAVFLIFPLIPVGILCGMFGHWFHDKPLSILSNFGLIALCGIIINDAVVFLTKFNSNIKEGMDIKSAAFQAGLDRFRPIMLTSITTVLGLYPLILGKSLQAQFLIPMAISVAYGVLFGTLLIIVCFPSMILIVNDIRRILSFIYNGGKWPKAEEVEPAFVEDESIKNRNLD
jgi:multidrug efflux pump subunit AcrB